MGKVFEKQNEDLKEYPTKSLPKRRLKAMIADTTGMRTRAQKTALGHSDSFPSLSAEFEITQPMSSSGDQEPELGEVNSNVDEHEELIGEQFDKVENSSESVYVVKHIVDHVMVIVEKPQRFKCPKCLVLFRDSYQMNRHFRSVHGEVITCNRCYTVLEYKEGCNLMKLYLFSK